MGGVSADGRVLWLTGRYDGERLRDQHPHRPAAAPHPGRRRARTALRVWPQPGRYSIGHTGILR